jgi:hypothetical protein
MLHAKGVSTTGGAMNHWSFFLKKVLSMGSPSNGDRASRPRGHKATKHDLKRGASTLAFHEILKELMAQKEEANAKRDVKRPREKEATLLIQLPPKEIS